MPRNIFMPDKFTKRQRHGLTRSALEQILKIDCRRISFDQVTHHCQVPIR